ncbi:MULTISPECIES: nitroreductase family protein [Vibrio]|jgi:nitroreductase/dihydropteridine reductase|uniref:NAD(P)H-dependent oxidoreductase n=1 Tax=Vibrio natriegens NBRC 15636 = ATCC 14048 = DSM 759 TaxID=1219067 RepID=A0AAN0Y2U3_VIBNA|nr:nitroreductase family protein [Vibrio natriegens]MEE3877790.1 nitroreductase family protein [Vibrio sp. YYF0003]ALR15390.1 flavin reductase [Vibrio natriegens NBRC 15636 = ATCC 14048 = DSM 759]ANQ12749.1 NAD(P)H-dependent oxidoreductase [Vibrio natriegens NBRC 15636 = ATCC 14048 = DSM 759]ANQ17092.1 NAD(P)H-dependent oxidoreductase [Vibrio natriegens]EPM38357.1 NAD(P)H-dependent flavin reductase [Vibrio natriegens NBRC 15636 = ATCC 14048 = DSM 759]
MSHPIIQDLNRRYTAKKYDASKRISQQDMDVIKEAIRLSASSINSQPWKFIVIESDEAKQRFHDTFANMHQFNQPHAKEASHIILFAHNPKFTKDDYRKVVDVEVSSGHLPAEMYDNMLNGAFGFAESQTNELGFNGHWTKAQTYIALGNTLHVLARLGIASTPMEGVDPEMIGKIFEKELDGYVCEFALAMGYHLEGEDYNYGLPKSRLAAEDVLVTL